MQAPQINISKIKDSLFSIYGFLILTSIILVIVNILETNLTGLILSIIALIILILIFPFFKKALANAEVVGWLSPVYRYIFLAIGIIYFVDALISFVQKSYLEGFALLVLGIIAIFASDLAKKIGKETIKRLEPLFNEIEKRFQV